MQKSLEDRIEDTKSVLKGLSLISDLLKDEVTKEALNLDETWCYLLKSENLYKSSTDDLDITERLVHSVESLVETCKDIVTSVPVLKFLRFARFKLWKKSDDDFNPTINIINRLLGSLKDEL